MKSETIETNCTEKNTMQCFKEIDAFSYNFSALLLKSCELNNVSKYFRMLNLMVPEH